jgi:hypothetical protein
MAVPGGTLTLPGQVAVPGNTAAAQPLNTSAKGVRRYEPGVGYDMSDTPGVAPPTPKPAAAPAPAVNPADYYYPNAVATQWPAAHAADPNFDQSQPGQAEAAYAQHGNDFYSPSAMGQLWSSVSGMDPSAPSSAGQYWNSVAGGQNTPTAATGAYHDFQGSTPANLDPAYDRAETTAAGAINDQLAARGLHGSSYGVGLIGSKVADLEAQKVKDNAQYGLQRAQLGGQLASASDQGRLAQILGYGNLAQAGGTGDLSRLGLLAGVAGGADSQRLGSLTAGMSAANVAQGAKRTRTQDYFNNIYQPSAMMTNQSGATTDNVLNSDQMTLEQLQALGLGIPAAAIAESNKARDTLYQNWDDADRIYKSIMSDGMSLGGSSPASKAGGGGSSGGGGGGGSNPMSMLGGGGGGGGGGGPMDFMSSATSASGY